MSQVQDVACENRSHSLESQSHLAGQTWIHHASRGQPRGLTLQLTEDAVACTQIAPMKRVSDVTAQND